MRIRILGDVQNFYGSFSRGPKGKPTIVDWPEADAQPLVDCGAAKLEPDAAAPEQEPGEAGADG